MMENSRGIPLHVTICQFVFERPQMIASMANHALVKMALLHRERRRLLETPTQSIQQSRTTYLKPHKHCCIGPDKFSCWLLLGTGDLPLIADVPRIIKPDSFPFPYTTQINEYHCDRFDWGSQTLMSNALKLLYWRSVRRTFRRVVDIFEWGCWMYNPLIHRNNGLSWDAWRSANIYPWKRIVQKM